MTDPEVIGDRERYAEVGRAYRQLEPPAKLAEEWRRARDDAAGAEELLSEDGQDAELREELLRPSRERAEELEEELRLAMVERDPNDSKNVIVEIQPGAGGEEAALWAGDLYRMLIKYAERGGFSTELMSSGEGKYTFAIKGDGAYSVFKFEGGTHRVQRVPETESQGRIHTSTATVAVLPEAEEVEVHDRPLRPADRRLPLHGSGRPVGQHHGLGGAHHAQADGIVVSMQDEKSQLQNRERALRVLRARLYERALAEQQAELAADRRMQVGTGDRAEKIRTYNYGERRVTDHRVKLTTHNLDQVLDGELDEFTAALAGRRAPPRASRRRRSRESDRRGAARGSASGRRAARERPPRELEAAGCETSRLDSELLLAHALLASRARELLATRSGRSTSSRGRVRRRSCAGASASASRWRT